ncbi:hypothetical protein SAMN05443429_11235 [Cruoricaptor ignavus]|uniref:Uncharacterized protein n=2 Tax=Cruoricaptor ignavus TaxID=1118202 RepID=A0A1M6HEA8_9FLAO|nr:hypothetical protein SAMN05443429_11235 [Cruoricaptor ignavus]
MLEVVHLFLIPKFNQLQMNATGEWLGSLEVKATEEGGQVWGRHYSEQLAKGREPGSMPPVEAIEKWVRAKFGLQGSEARSRAWAVAKSIEKKGTTWYQRGGSDLIEVLESNEVKEFVEKKIGQIITVVVAEELIRNAEKMSV